MTDVSKFDDVIDSRDVIARIEELEAEREGLVTAAEESAAELEEAHTDLPEDASPDALEAAQDAAKNANEVLADWDNGSEGDELRVLKALADEASGYATDWSPGEVLIRDSYFQKYAEQLADDLGLVPSDAGWPMTCIDWEQAARELQQDYTSVDFDGETYWIR